jgi:hypothetical protein
MTSRHETRPQRRDAVVPREPPVFTDLLERHPAPGRSEHASHLGQCAVGVGDGAEAADEHDAVAAGVGVGERFSDGDGELDRHKRLADLGGHPAAHRGIWPRGDDASCAPEVPEAGALPGPDLEHLALEAAEQRRALTLELGGEAVVDGREEPVAPC